MIYLDMKIMCGRKKILVIVVAVLLANCWAMAAESENDELSQLQNHAFAKDMMLADALRYLAAKYKQNLAPPTNITDKVAVGNLYNVTFEQALGAVLGDKYIYKTDGNFIRIYLKSGYEAMIEQEKAKEIAQMEDKSRLELKVFQLYYIRAKDIESLIKPVLSESGKIKSSQEASTEISTGDDGVSGEAGGDSMALNDSIVVYDFPENIEKVAFIIKTLDVRPKQVLIEATILSATLTEGMQFGVDLNMLSGSNLIGTSDAAQDTTTGISSVNNEQNVLQQIQGLVKGSPMETSGFAAIGTSGMRIGIRSGPITGFITALESVTDVTVLANPKILALNKQLGTVFIGQKIGYRDRTTIDSSGQATVGEVKFMDTGTKLSFRPYIGNDGYIRMDIYPKDSSGELDNQGIPTETTAELSTNILVRDGHTIVIGGLFRDAITSARSQIPLIGDLPLIGAAFRSTTDATIRQEVIVLLTPHIIDSPEQLNGDQRAEDVSRKRFAAKQALQWQTRAFQADEKYTKAAKLYLDGDTKGAMKKLKEALSIRPTYLEALRLRDRIVGQTDPNEYEKLGRNVQEAVERQASDKWKRR